MEPENKHLIIHYCYACKNQFSSETSKDTCIYCGSFDLEDHVESEDIYFDQIDWRIEKERRKLLKERYLFGCHNCGDEFMDIKETTMCVHCDSTDIYGISPAPVPVDYGDLSELGLDEPLFKVIKGKKK